MSYGSDQLLPRRASDRYQEQQPTQPEIGKADLSQVVVYSPFAVRFRSPFSPRPIHSPL
jgi:hypothetical protein